MSKTLNILAWSLAIAACAGCRREQIRVYTAPRDPPAPEMAVHGAEDGHEHGADIASRPRPQLSYQLPAGWKEISPGRMNVASFSIAGAGGKEADVTVTPLGMLAGRESDVVNMFRERVGLPSLTPEEVAKDLRDVQVGNEKGKLFEIVGKADTDGATQRIVTAIVHRSDASWFYRLSGDDSIVQAQHGTFLEFLKSIAIKEAAPEENQSVVSDGRKWQVPGDWKEIPAGQMQVARFAISEKSGGKAEVFVSVFPSDTGGTLANVNRWRRQLKLSELTQPELKSSVTPLEDLPGAVLTDMTNDGQQLVGVIVPRGGQYWFYKMLGDTGAVGPQRENFVRFVKSNP